MVVFIFKHIDNSVSSRIYIFLKFYKDELLQTKIKNSKPNIRVNNKSKLTTQEAKEDSATITEKYAADKKSIEFINKMRDAISKAK